MPMITDFTENTVTRQACAVLTDINSADYVAFTDTLVANPTYDYHIVYSQSLNPTQAMFIYVLTEKVDP